MATPQERAEWLHNNVDSDLQYVFQESGIGEQVQYNLGQHYRTMRRFSSIADDRAGLRAALQDDFGMRPDSAANRASIAAVVSAWESSKYAHEEEIKLRQEAKQLGAPRPLPHTDRAAMLRALEQNKGDEIGERDQPSTEYIAQLLEGIEQDEIQAHPLDEVTSRKESQSQLRSKLRLEAHAWLMVASKMKNKVYLRGLEQRHFDQYTEYLLGEKCYTMKVPAASGEKTLLNPPWHILLDYEFELRTKAIKKARKDGTMLGTALLEATQDSEVKELHFTSPITLAAAQRPAKVPRWDPPATPGASSTFYGGKSGGGKGKGAKGKKGKQGRSFPSTFLPGTKLELITHTPDGQEICYRYNMKGKKCDGKCNRVHICRVKGCGQQHPACEHPSDA
eukprot:s1635_g3.t1